MSHDGSHTRQFFTVSAIRLISHSRSTFVNTFGGMALPPAASDGEPMQPRTADHIRAMHLLVVVRGVHPVFQECALVHACVREFVGGCRPRFLWCGKTIQAGHTHTHTAKLPYALATSHCRHRACHRRTSHRVCMLVCAGGCVLSPCVTISTVSENCVLCAKARPPSRPAHLPVGYAIHLPSTRFCLHVLYLAM